MTSIANSTKSSSWNDGKSTNDNLAEARDGLNQVKSDLHTLGSDISNVAKSGAAAAQDGIAHAADSAKKRGSDAIQTVSKHISENPMASIGIAAAVGLIVGMVCLRSRS